MPRLTPQYAAQAIGVTPRTLHRWAREGRIVRHADGFDLKELVEAEKSRDMAALLARAGIKREHWPADVRSDR